jgi:eukaryotic-like serine/threonine-protein kinase
MSSLLGTTLNGRYRLEERIAAGGMSTVYRALDETLQRQVAVKLMHREVAGDSDQLERFRREARAVAQLSHPQIVGVIDAGEDDGRPYIVLEYVAGETLKQRIRRHGQMPIPEAVAYAIEIARGLGAAHAHHIVHRDVKPQNVLIDEEGAAKVTDFGIARTLEEKGLTADGRVLGTTDYVSPEQALGQPVTGQSDLYSLGVVLYEMLTGEVPFHGDNQVAVAMKHVREEIPDVRLLRPEVSAALAAVVDTATAKHAGERYADDAEMIAELEDVLAIETARAGGATTGEVTAVLNTLPPEKRRRVPFSIMHRGVAAVLVLLLVIAAIAVVVFLATRTHHDNGGKHNTPPPVHHATVVKLTTAASYNPDSLGSDHAQNDAAAPNVLTGADGGWTTENYYDKTLGKPGVGVYVQSASGAAVATRLTLTTSTPGFAVQIWGANGKPNLDNFNDSGWVKLGSSSAVESSQSIALSSHGTGYRYFLVWITKLPPEAESANITKVKLLR